MSAQFSLVDSLRHHATSGDIADKLCGPTATVARRAGLGIIFVATALVAPPVCGQGTPQPAGMQQREVVTASPPQSADRQQALVTIEPASSSTNVIQSYAPKTLNFADFIDQALKVAAILVGAAWVLFNYLRNRTHRARLEGKISASITTSDPELVKLTALLKNVGQAKVNITQKGTVLVVSCYEKDTDTWHESKTVTAFERVQWIEPGETREEQQLLRIPPAPKAPIKFDLSVNCWRSEWWRGRSEQVLSATYILAASVTPMEDKDGRR